MTEQRLYRSPDPATATERDLPVKISDLFESRYLRAADLPVDRDVTVEIAGVTVEDLVTPDGPERKGVVRFVGHQRGLVLNKTNANTITELLGTEETEHWIGKRIALFVTSAPFRGRMVPAIRVRPTPVLNDAAVPADGAGTPNIEQLRKLAERRKRATPPPNSKRLSDYTMATTSAITYRRTPGAPATSTQR